MIRKLIATVIYRGLILAFTMMACVYLARQFGPWKAMGIWAVALLVGCVGTALLLRRQEVGTRNVVNRMAGYLLMWGYKVTQGKLVRMVAASWVVWVLLGAAVISLDATVIPNVDEAAVGPQYQVVFENGEMGQPGWELALKAILFIAWNVLGMGIHHTLGVMVMNRRVNPPLVLPTLVLVGLIAVSAAVFFLSPSKSTLIKAVLISAGPPTVIAGGYGLMLLVFLVGARKGSWH